MKALVRAPAKINLSLDVVGKREDGYHLLETVMQSVSLFDYVSVKADTGAKGINISCDDSRIPVDERNIAYIAARKFVQAAELMADITIDIKKIIPLEAGLAGGSTDAAAVLFALSKLFPAVLRNEDLYKIAVETGADVPFCLHGGTVFCRGIGEKLTVLKPLVNIPLLLVKPDKGLQTAQVFRKYRTPDTSDRPDTARVLQSIDCCDIEKLAVCTANVLEAVSIAMRPDIGLIKHKIQASGAVLTLMSGSGPSVFGLYADESTRDAAARKISAELPDALTIVASTLDHGPQIIDDKEMESW